jgi:hypothetical protein
VPAAVEPVEEVNEPAEAAAIYSAAPRFRYLVLGALAVLLVAVIAGAVVLREKFRERNSPAAETSLATRTEPASAPAVATPANTEEPGVTEQPRIAERPRVTEEAVAATPNLTGEWSVVNTVNTTSYQSFQNLRIGFAVSINQTGTTFTARGRKVSENGRTLPANSRTPIELKGVINGDHIEATFSEQGSQRKTNGRFVWKIDRAGGLTGTFASSAARTTGKSTATREL